MEEKTMAVFASLPVALSKTLKEFEDELTNNPLLAIEKAVAYIGKMEELIVSVKDGIAVQNNAIKLIDETIDALKQKCFDYLKSQNLDLLKSGDSTLKIAKNPPKIVIHGKLAEQQLLKDDRFVSIKREINKSAIKDFLLNNKMLVIEGEGGENLAEIQSSERLDIK